MATERCAPLHLQAHICSATEFQQRFIDEFAFVAAHEQSQPLHCEWFIYTHTHAHTQMHMHTYTHSHTHADTHTQTHMHLH